MSTSFRCAAIVYGPGDDVDAALAAAVDSLRQAGRRVGGLLQRFGAQIAEGKREMFLEVLPDGEIIRLNEIRGSGVQGCILDTDALARATMAFHEAASNGPDLLLASRFGKEEASGGGMRFELAEAIMNNTPLLVPVRANMLPAWSAFLARPAEVLAPDTTAILNWAAEHGVGCPAWVDVMPAVGGTW